VALDAGSERYRLLETVRQYAQERLGESGEEQQARTRHLHYFLELAEKARPQLIGPQQAAWLAQLDLERENLLAAHAWCDHAESGGELGLRLVHASKQYWVNRGQLGVRHRLTVDALARGGVTERNLERCRGLFNAAQVCCFMGRYAEAREYLDESVSIARQIDNPIRVEMALQLLGMAYLGEGALEPARRHLEEALTLATELGDKRELASATNALAQLHHVGGALGEAEPLYNRVLKLAYELGDQEIVATGLLSLAMVSISRRDAATATQFLEEAISVATKIGSQPAIQSVIEVSAGLARLRGEWVRVARFYGSAETQAEETGLRRAPADEIFLKSAVSDACSALGVAAFHSAESAGRALAHGDAIAELRTWLAPGEGSAAPR
jgi:non-specific serine/threonine protein kinase